MKKNQEVQDFSKDENTFIEGVPLTAEEVKNSQNKEFQIIELPSYETFEDRETHEVKRLLKLQILFNGAKVSYRPNKNSQGELVKNYGRRLSDWVGKKGTFETLSQMIGKEKKEVIYIKKN